jgi:hypothetical protein
MEAELWGPSMAHVVGLPRSMPAMVLEAPGRPLVRQARPLPQPGDPGQVLLRVRVCEVCRTDLHLVAGELPDPRACQKPVSDHGLLRSGPGVGPSCKSIA